MTGDLADAIREVVRDYVNESTLDRLEIEAGSTSSPQREPTTSDWYASLPDDGKDHLRRIVSAAVDETIDGLLGVLDDVREIEVHHPTPDRDTAPDASAVCFVVDSGA